MPARITAAPRALPLQFLIVKLRLGKPQHKVGLVPLVAVLIHIITHAHTQIVFIVIGQRVIFLQLGCVKINILAGLICIAFFQQHFDHVDEFRDAVGRRLYHIRHTDVQLGKIIKKCLGVVIRDLQHCLVLTLCTLEHLVFAGIRIAG